MTPANDDRLLDAALDALKSEEARASVPEHVEAAMLRAWDRHAGRHRARMRGRFGFGRIAALAAGVVLVVGVLLPRLGRELTQPSSVAPSVAAPAASDPVLPAPLSQSLPVPSRLIEELAPRAEPSATHTSSEESAMLVLLGEPIATGEAVRVVRMRVPGATLTELGIRPIAMSREQTVDLEVIVGEDGVARALRVGM